MYGNNFNDHGLQIIHNLQRGQTSKYGSRLFGLCWIKSFLSDRTKKVVVEGKSSSSAPVTSGVPQSTVLGHLLFLAYINDLPSKVNAKARLFADDCLLYRNIKTDEDAESLQDDLNKLQDLEADWQMHFNPLAFGQ